MPSKTFKAMLASVVDVFKAHHDPHEIALGVALGAFIAVLPVYGLHTLLCIAVALLVPRANKLAILLGTNISLPPTIATITWTAYDIGRLVLPGGHYPPLSWEYVKGLNLAKLGQFYYPLFIGSIVLGLVCAVVLYGVTRVIAEHFRRERSRVR
jgi:uncharacterized protein